MSSDASLAPPAVAPAAFTSNPASAPVLPVPGLHAAAAPWLAEAQRLREQFHTDAVARDQAGGRPSAQIKALKAAGLLRLQIPAALGGAGQPWSTVLRVVRELARTDGSVAHLYGYHFVVLAGLLFRDPQGRAPELLRQTAAHDWFWGNASNSFSKSLHGRLEGEVAILNGVRPFASGTHVADRLLVAWEDEATGLRYAAALPPDRAGLHIQDDWSGIGQRQTGSGQVRFEQVHVPRHEWVGGPSAADPTQASPVPFRTLTPLLQQSVLLNVFLGSALGILDEARDYTRTRSRPWLYSGVTQHSDDPWVKRRYGEFWIQIQAATALADRALQALDDAWAQGEALSAAQRGQAAVAVAAANVLAGEVALKVSEQAFEVMGARAATRAQGFDRFWRNVRVHTLHNPAEYKTRNVGRWFLSGAFPEPGVFQ